MGCIPTSNSNKGNLIIRVMELNYYIYMYNQSIICLVRGLEAIRHLPLLRVKSDPSYAVVEVERVNVVMHSIKLILSFFQRMCIFSQIKSHLFCGKRY